jgi:acetoin utilization protein AcuB
MEAHIELAGQSIAHIMTTRVVKVGMDETLGHVKNIFRKCQFHHLLVVEQGKLVGIISDRDVLKAVSPYVGTLSETTRDLATLSKRVHQIMSHHLITARVTTTFQEAAELMIKEGVSCLPVISADGTLLGLITWKDLLKALFNFVP